LSSGRKHIPAGSYPRLSSIQFLSFIRLETERRMKLNREVHILHLLNKWLKIKFLIFAGNSPVSD
ncbi:hypothetical protein, partial [Phocaeicola coprocola]|uniref:hypothetical protein n=1 Tax=Phocaeicola coprocola TaxID=310298 RepID=UPI003AF16678